MGRPCNVGDEAILDALSDHPEVTSAEVAETLGIGQSTAAKRLAALETAGSVHRSPGGRVNGRRLADRWAAAASPAASATAPPAPAGPAPVVGEPVVGHPEPDTEPAAAAAGEADGVETKVVGTGRPTADAAPGDPAGETAGRLGRGELGSLVRDYLAAHPDESFGPSALGKALGRSQGAISNSLAAMAARGDVVLVGDKPRRYRIAAG